MKKTIKFRMSHFAFVYFLAVFAVFALSWFVPKEKLTNVDDSNIQLESKEFKQANDEVESLHEEIQTKTLSADQNDKGYVKIQDRMSMDFSAEDVRYIIAFIDIRGGTVEDRALNMVIMLNNIYETRMPIKEYVTSHLGAHLTFDFNDIELDRKAYEMVTYDRWDESNGERWFYK